MCGRTTRCGLPGSHSCGSITGYGGGASREFRWGVARGNNGARAARGRRSDPRLSLLVQPSRAAHPSLLRWPAVPADVHVLALVAWPHRRGVAAGGLDAIRVRRSTRAQVRRLLPVRRSCGERLATPRRFNRRSAHSAGGLTAPLLLVTGIWLA